MERTVFYHHPCLDGSVAAWSVYKKYGDDARYIGLDHSDYLTIEKNIAENITPDTIAMFVDFAPRRQVLENIIDKVAAIEIYDHHVSAQKDLAAFMDHPKCDIHFDMERSGAGMAFDVFSNESERPLFVELVEKLDLYKPHEFASAEQFYLISAYLSSIDVTRSLSKLMPEFETLSAIENIAWFEERGDAPRRAYLEKIDEVMAGLCHVDLSFLKTAPKSVKVPLVRASINDLGHEFSPLLLDACPDQNKMGMVWEYHDEDTVKLSLRSDGTIDVSLIAEEMGREHGLNGGGHKGASAVRFTREQFDIFAGKIGLSFK